MPAGTLMGDLTKDFSLDEFLVSDEAGRRNIFNIPLPEHLTNIQTLLAPFCQAVRDKVRRPVLVMSGYRCPQLNAAVGGVPNSSHGLGLAADLATAGMTARGLAHFIVGDTALMVSVDQIILETSRNVVHVGVGGTRRGQVLTQPLGPGTAFHPGIV